MITIILVIIGFIGCWKIENKYKFEKSTRTERDKCQSYIEERLYDALVKEGYKPITQYRCGYYWIDIAIPEYRLAIECDGKQWHSTPEQKRHDRKKNYYLKKNGWKVCRLSGKTINNNLGGAIKHIKKRALF